MTINHLNKKHKKQKIEMLYFIIYSIIKYTIQMKSKQTIYYKAIHPEYGTWFFTTKTKLAVILRLKSPYIYAKYKRSYTNDDPRTGKELHYLNGWAIEEMKFPPDAPISKLNPSYDRVYNIEKWREDDFKEKHPFYNYED